MCGDLKPDYLSKDVTRAATGVSKCLNMMVDSNYVTEGALTVCHLPTCTGSPLNDYKNACQAFRDHHTKGRWMSFADQEYFCAHRPTGMPFPPCPSF